MKTRWRSEADEWTTDGSKISSADNLNVVRAVLEEGSVIVEHWFYRGSRSPNRLIFDDFDDFLNHLNNETYAGDAIHIWSFAALCKDENTIAHGKCPDETGQIPKSGAY